MRGAAKIYGMSILARGVEDGDVSRALEELIKRTNFTKVVGSYPRST